MCTVGGRIGWIVTRSGTARRPGIPGTTTPVLSILARRILCIPATSAPSERVFSVAGLTISKCRTSILPQHASDLIFLHDSWQLAEECEMELNRESSVPYVL